ncbi:MAG: polyprenyl synthetase family protein [Chloroflexota bacterium]
MSLEHFKEQMLPAIEDEIRAVVAQVDEPGLYHMLAYHLGWEKEGEAPSPGGKRIRPLILLLTNEAASGKWKFALPAAAAVELVHNFSLIHDDIEDQSPLRRGCPTVWQKWGVAQAINAGDTMFSLANLAFLGLVHNVPEKVFFQAVMMLERTCLRLTQGQYLDIAYEGSAHISQDEYWSMVAGKTASLLATCTLLGALIAGAPEVIQGAYQEYGRNLGFAFQIVDDYLGIWGDDVQTGKSTQSDLVTGKKTLPVVFGLERGKDFARRWLQGSITPEEVSLCVNLLEEEGAQTYTLKKANEYTEKALAALCQAEPQGRAGEALFALTDRLLKRGM